MAILPVTQEDVESFTVLINPPRYYSSSSSGVTGSIKLFPRGSTIEKEIRPISTFSSSLANDEDLETSRLNVLQAASSAVGGSIFGNMNTLLEKINSQPPSVKKQKKIEVIRFTPGVSLNSNTIRKWNVKDNLMSFYRNSYPSAHWGYTNYHTLNFFSSNDVPSSSVLLYPSIDNPNLEFPAGHVSGSYALSGAFSFDFFINPRYNIDHHSDGGFKAGTIFHLSSTYALSLVTGSSKDPRTGLPSSFRLLLQLSHSADIPPSKATPGSYPNDLIFLSDDNSLSYNEWSRVVVRWGTNLVQDGTGSFNINKKDKGTFVVPSGTIDPRVFVDLDDPKVLSVGNFYEGTNKGTKSQSIFFAEIPSIREGLTSLVPGYSDRDEPLSYMFNHPLKAELHNLAIHRHYMADDEIESTSEYGPSTLDPLDVAFYVPPFFVEKTPIRKFTDAPSLGGSPYGGILQTPFFEINGSTDDPFNVAMSFGVNGHYINLENFVKDFSNNTFPRLHHLSGTAIAHTTEALEANEFLYNDPFVRKRNLTILPCDDGKFIPNFGLLTSETSVNKAVDFFGRKDLSIISLDNLVNTSSLLFSSIHDAESNPDMLSSQLGYTPENPGLPPGPAVKTVAKMINNAVDVSTDDSPYDPGVQREMPLTIFQRTKDPSSNQVTFFDISNVFYGSRILPGSFQITDISLSGSGGGVGITLRDDSHGNIYRADSTSLHCTWNSVGNIFYNEGIVVIKSPHLYFYGKNGYEMSFKGEHHLHSMKYEILAPSGLLNSSSNPSYALVQDKIKASGDPLDTDVFVYISNINFHDENLNVVAKANLAQPIIKREKDKILFKVAFDF